MRKIFKTFYPIVNYFNLNNLLMLLIIIIIMIIYFSINMSAESKVNTNIIFNYISSTLHFFT